MRHEEIQIGTWITIGKRSPFPFLYGYVIKVYPDGSMDVGYYQNRTKVIKEQVVWKDGYWDWVYPGALGGGYLDGSIAKRIKDGPKPSDIIHYSEK